MTNSELTALHTETMEALRKASAAARTLANISRRAANLLSDGYQVRSFDGTDCHIVTSPKGDKYVVWHGLEVGYECNCPCFAEWNTCKHLEAIDLLKKEAAEAAELDARAERDAYDPYEYRH